MESTLRRRLAGVEVVFQSQSQGSIEGRSLTLTLKQEFYIESMSRLNEVYCQCKMASGEHRKAALSTGS